MFHHSEPELKISIGDFCDIYMWKIIWKIIVSLKIDFGWYNFFADKVLKEEIESGTSVCISANSFAPSIVFAATIQFMK